MSLATTNKRELFSKGGILSEVMFITVFFNVSSCLRFPLCTDTVLGMLQFKGEEEAKEGQNEMRSVRRESVVFLRSYKDHSSGSSPPRPFRNISNLSPFLTPVSCLRIREKLRLILRNEHLDSSMENIL